MSKASVHVDGNAKETVESILIAFIFAFIFRAFVVEAFVIPTGSMAPTLYGAHVRLQCPDCGYTFDVGAMGTPNAANDDVDIPDTESLPIDYHCPNCNYEFHNVGPNGEPVQERVRFGDRILVLKYLYLFQQPVRWDVVVFKSPDEPQGHHVPEDPEYGQNYIKRLVGIGPESVVILDGDVYTGPIDAEGPLSPKGEPLFKIQRKPAYAQNALWRVIYNNDFVPHLGYSTHTWHQPWQQERGTSGWALAGPSSPGWPAGTPSRVFEFSNPKGQGAVAFNPEANAESWWPSFLDPQQPKAYPLSDYLAYDEAEHRDPRHHWSPLYVSDLNLACEYTRLSGDGPLRLQLSKRQDLFTAEITPGRVRLLRASRNSADKPTATNERQLYSVEMAALSGASPARVELSNVDYRVSVRVNDQEVIATTDADYSPDINALWNEEKEAAEGDGAPPPFARPIVRIEAASQSARLEHLVLSRDIHYLTHNNSQFWATTHRITHLNAGEYFVLGDNSFISGDARYWQDRIFLPHEGLDVESGRVPEQFMLGKAFFVYWPAGYKVPGVPVNLVPDFGEMRFIH